MFVLGRNKETAETLEHMRMQEVEHLSDLDVLVADRRVRPSALLPVWEVAGFALGAVTAAMGKEAAMACTVAVEDVIGGHYNDQIRDLLAEFEPDGGGAKGGSVSFEGVYEVATFLAPDPLHFRERVCDRLGEHYLGSVAPATLDPERICIRGHDDFCRGPEELGGIGDGNRMVARTDCCHPCVEHPLVA